MFIDYSWLIPTLPVISFLLIILFGRKTPSGGGYIAVAFVGLSLIISLGTIYEVINAPLGYQEEIPFFGSGWHWMPETVPGFEFGVLIDSLAALMLLVVNGIGFLIVVYSLSYMKGDDGIQRYFAEISLFIAAMLALIVANNWVFFFISWEIVGLCSYLLIGFWYKKPSAASAAKKAFLVTRIGDLLLLAGIIVLYAKFGTLNLVDLFQMAEQSGEGWIILGHSGLTVAALLLFGGAVGKSGQFPLHVWLPDAMEGPTTVSALIHAATMVKAGVYLVARAYPLFTPDSLIVVAWIGGITALIAATMALVMNDIKRVIAYSTLSHLGFMTLALGVGAYGAGMFHLLNHAFFKALLFLSAGAIIHATHTQDIRDLGGLRKFMPITAGAFLIGAWSNSGVPFLGGFWSKDEIILGVKNVGGAFSGSYDTIFPGAELLMAVTLAAAFLSSAYIFRLFIITFMGKPGEASSHAHETPMGMLGPILVVATGAALSFLLVWTDFNTWILHSLPPEVFHRMELMEHNYVGKTGVMVTSVLFATLGLLVAVLVYQLKIVESRRIVSAFRPVHTLIYNKYYIDHFYLWFSKSIITGIGNVSRIVDDRVVDGLVNGTGKITVNSGSLARKVQTGIIQDYTTWVLLGISFLLFLGLARGGLL